MLILGEVSARLRSMFQGFLALGAILKEENSNTNFQLKKGKIDIYIYICMYVSMYISCTNNPSCLLRPGSNPLAS